MLKNMNRRGLALMPVLIVVAILSLATTLMHTIASHKTQNVVGEERMLQAFYAAEAGLETTRAAILHNPVWYRNLSCMGQDVFEVLFHSIDVDQGVTCQVTANKQQQAIGSGLTVKAVGTCHGAGQELLARKTLQTIIGVFELQDYLYGLTVLPGPAGAPVLSGPMSISATLIVDGSVALDQNKVVQGDVYAGRNITGSCSGNKISNYLYIPPVPELNEAYYWGRAGSYGQVWETGTAFVGPAEPGADVPAIPVYNGYYFIRGDLDLAGYYQGRALFFSTGDIRIKGDLVPGGGEDPGPDTGWGSLTLVALGDVDIQQHNVYANILALGHLRARPGASLAGAACVAGVMVEGDNPGEFLHLHYEPALTPVEGTLAGPALKTINWQELYPVF